MGMILTRAYASARKLAFNHESDRALLLCNYILAKVPGHADTQILMGRIHAWQGKYEMAAEILKEAIRKYPTYADGYAALLDVYFWSDQDEEAMILVAVIERNGIKSKEVTAKNSPSLRSPQIQSRKGSERIAQPAKN